jgi:biopolymer transport protein ExbD
MPLQLNKGRSLGLLDLTPMIDVVFNLLIFFMVVSHFATTERDLKVRLPDGSEAMPITARPKELFVNIDDQGRYFVRSRQVTREELGEILTQAALNNPTSQTVAIRADKRSSWDAVATAMRLCNQAGVHDYYPVYSNDP